MDFTGLDIKHEYRSLLGDVVRDFYTPVLSRSVKYCRAVGFFSSSALISLTEGIRGLLENRGTIEVIASPRLSEEDVAAIQDGFDRRNEIITDCLLRELSDPVGKFEEARLNLLSNLIAAGVLSLKIAFLDDDNGIGMFHEKLGLLYDSEGNTIAFSGSMNESTNAFYHNYEAIDVFTSWTADAERVRGKQAAFTALWDDYEPGVSVMEFPEVSSEIVRRYTVRDGIDLSDLDVVPDSFRSRSDNIVATAENTPHIPNGVNIRPYQDSAINEWEAHGFTGIFDMATGTGKTFTALAAVCKLSEHVGHNLAVIIVCPYQHLVEQWREDITLFGMKPIVCYSASQQRNWKERLKNSVSGFRAGAIERFCAVTTNASFATPFMQGQIKRLKGNCLIVVDEAHNLGSKKNMKTLPAHFSYRLGLSATIERYGDEEGTQALFDYFGEKCIEYTLEDAIHNGMLTHYYYHPIPVYLDEDELESYSELSLRISKLIASSKTKRRSDLPESAKMLLIKRARIIAGAHQKLDALRTAISPHREESHMLVYCGATTIHDDSYVEGSPDDCDVRQIDAVSRMLGNDLGMKVAQFTSAENADKREVLKREFADGKHMQALVAIRCLDEGVNIPSIKTAFILASSTNPKEYVQRRGRVLRLADDKMYAVIYDFITLPFPLEQVGSYSTEMIRSTASLAARELVRMKDFAYLSENPSESLGLAEKIEEAFDLTQDDLEGDNYA